jgi:hypothetical protein
MFSGIVENLVYNDVSPDIIEHDVDIDADQWTYENRDVYRGSQDNRYTEARVYWLYDDDLRRVGLVEYDLEDPTKFNVLWFYDNQYATLFQNPDWKPTGTTIWSRMSPEAYQDCLSNDFKNVFDMAINSGILLITPTTFINRSYIYECTKCKKKSLSKFNCSDLDYEVDFFKYSILFIDDDFIIYETSTSEPPVASVQVEKVLSPV